MWSKPFRCGNERVHMKNQSPQDFTMDVAHCGDSGRVSSLGPLTCGLRPEACWDSSKPKLFFTGMPSKGVDSIGLITNPPVESVPILHDETYAGVSGQTWTLQSFHRYKLKWAFHLTVPSQPHSLVSSIRS